MDMIMLYLILILCASVVLTPVVFSIIDRRWLNNYIKQLKDKKRLFYHEKIWFDKMNKKDEQEKTQ